MVWSALKHLEFNPANAMPELPSTWNLGAQLTFYLNSHLSYFHSATPSSLKGGRKIMQLNKQKKILHMIFIIYEKLFSITFFVLMLIITMYIYVQNRLALLCSSYLFPSIPRN